MNTALDFEVTDEIIERVEQVVGTSTRGWDMVDPKELIRAAVAAVLEAQGAA